MPEHEVVIAGGGPAGMMLAAELALAKVDVAVVERRGDHVLAGARAGGVHARTIEVRLATLRGKTVLTIVDDGAGFNQAGGEAPAADQFGLVGMRERTKQIGGQFQCRSQPGQGTTIEIVLPSK